MNKKVQLAILLGIGILLFVLSGLEFVPAVLLSVEPWWMYVVILGILVSAYYFMKYSLEDRRIDNDYIEKEGQVYMERIEAARAKKNAYHEES